MECVVFDTSFLLNAIKGKSDFMQEIRGLLGEFRAVVPSPVRRELEKLAGRKGDARVALQLLERAGAELAPSVLGADRSVVAVAEERGGWVASTDAEVRRAARGAGLRLVTLRKGKRVVL
jgi:rRNA-processing protein FCF1